MKRLLYLSLFAAVFCAHAEPPSLAKAKADYDRSIDAATTPLREHYLWQLEALRRAAQNDATVTKAIDAEISRVGGVLSDPIPATLVGVWSNNNETPFYGKTVVITSDGRGFLTGGAGMGAPFHWRYIAATTTLLGTMLMQREEREAPRPVVTIELHLDAAKTELAVTAYKAIFPEFGSEREFLKERFTRKATEIPEELKKKLQ